jgi:hypothetical protein
MFPLGFIVSANAVVGKIVAITWLLVLLNIYNDCRLQITQQQIITPGAPII